MRPRIKAEIAKTPEQHAAGLMGRKHLPGDAGMLFDFGSRRPLSFWMANTYIPLQIAFIRDDGKIGQIESMTPLNTKSVLSDGNYRYALEVNDGWFDQHGLQVGAQLALPGQNNPAVAPDAVVDASFKDVLYAADSYGVKLTIEYVNGDGEKSWRNIDPPIEFSDSAEGDPDGLVSAWDESKGEYRHFLVDRISGIFDPSTYPGVKTPITTADQVAQISSNQPMTQEDERDALGKMFPVEEKVEGELQ